MATLIPAVRTDRNLAATAIGNTSAYLGVFATGDTFARLLRQAATDVEEARAEAAERRERLGAERERNRQHRLLHDSALQTLEIVAQGSRYDWEELRRQARQEARVIRRALSGESTPQTGLATGLEELVEEFSGRGLQVELVTAELEREPPSLVSTALQDAAREALTNVVKHAEVNRAVLRATSSNDGWHVTVRDQGRGFDIADATTGFGVQHSIKDRLTEVDGRVLLWSAPGRGTKVELWVPSA